MKNNLHTRGTLPIFAYTWSGITTTTTATATILVAVTLGTPGDIIAAALLTFAITALIALFPAIIITLFYFGIANMIKGQRIIKGEEPWITSEGAHLYSR